MKRTLLYASALLLTTCIANRSVAQCDPVITPNTVILCPNETDTLWSDVHDTYQWMKDGILVSGATNQYYVVDANTDIGSLFAVITTTTGCTGPDTSADVLVDGWAFLLPFVINITNTQLCPGVSDSVVFDFSLDSNVQWYFNNSPIPGATNDTFVAYATGFYTAEGAPDVCPNYIMQLGLNLSVDSNQPPVILPDSIPLCPGGVTTIATTLVTYDSFQWYYNGQAVSNSNNSSLVTFTSGFYHVTTDEDGCILSSDSIVVYDHVPLTPIITQGGNVLYSVPGGSQLSNFQWYLNGVPVSGATDSTFTPSASGSYTVSAYDGTCIDTSAAYVFTVSVNEVNAQPRFEIYPNPAQDNIYIKGAVPLSVVLIDNIGRIVYYNDKTAMAHIVPVAQLPKGIYTIKLIGKDHTAYEKVVVE